jgi:hypothetical protein
MTVQEWLERWEPWSDETQMMTRERYMCGTDEQQRLYAEHMAQGTRLREAMEAELVKALCFEVWLTIIHRIGAAVVGMDNEGQIHPLDGIAEEVRYWEWWDDEFERRLQEHGFTDDLMLHIAVGRRLARDLRRDLSADHFDDLKQAMAERVCLALLEMDGDD